MREKLTVERIAADLQVLAGWVSTGTEIEKTYEFPSYKDGLVFACAVGYLADSIDHHPDMMIGYRRVRIGLSTHDAGGITETDIRLAKRIESL